ncbi:cytochrome P450 [Dietzia maris]|uniref:cytochrome P450 n=1 Tax=Dietzia maris TaxID=37915 RepID=UPI0022734FB9
MPGTRPLIDQTAEFLRSGYLFASRVRRAAGVDSHSDAPVRIRLLGRPALLVRGEAGVRFFYDSDVFRRAGAMPAFVRGPLFGAGAVHGLDGDAHRIRKNALADLAYDDDRVARFAAVIAEELEEMLATVGRRDWASVYDQTTVTFGRAAFRWADLPVTPREADRRARQMSRLLDTFGRPATNAIAWLERARLDRWAIGLVRFARGGDGRVDPDSVLGRIADLRDEHGQRVDDHTAAVELQNLTRPTVAVARFAAFAAIALVEHPDWARRIREATDAHGGLVNVPEAVAFAQEVRRTYPFVPMLPAVATVDTQFQGCPVNRGQRVFLDLLGTNTDPNHWEDPGTFDPARFLDVADAEQLGAFVPQGGTGVRTSHRCPGEKIAVTALSAAIAALSRPGVKISDDVEDLTFPWTTMLTRPATGVRFRYTPPAAG